MIEVRFHGRGGQGAVIASEILAAALFAEGKFVQAFPAFGIERRGAPVTAFLRISSSPIRLRCQIETPDHVVILDPTLIAVVDVTAGLKQEGWIIVNTDHEPSAFPSLTEQGWRVATVDAADIAARHELGARTNPIVNTAILGAFAQVTGMVRLDSVVRAIEEGVPVKPSQNREAAREAFASVQMPVLEGVES
jgi:2-oxoacid:acceptor oxidoreductase gamma subunit (pyruvate/2-ketoisovalerate family)